MKFLVTGGAGFIGSHIVEYLVRHRHSVVVIDNLHGGNSENLDRLNSKIEFFKLNILEYAKLKEIAKNVDGIFHEAALTSVQESFIKKTEYNDVNVVGTENIFRIAQEFGVKVVFASSAAVYGDVKKISIQEDSERKPLNPYGETKMKAELLAEKYSNLGTKIIGLRYFNVYGPRQNNAYSGVITKFLLNIASGIPPLIYGNGLQVRDFVHVTDVANANLLAMKSETRQGFINIGTGIATSILELAKMVIRASGLKLEPIYGESLKGDVQKSLADVNLARSLLGWKSEIKLENWINMYVKSLVQK